MLNNIDTILIKAKPKTQNNIQEFLKIKSGAECVCVNSENEVKNLLSKSRFDLIIYQYNVQDQKKLTLNQLHTKLRQNEPVPVIYLIPRKQRDLADLEKLETGSYDVFIEPTDINLLFNRISTFLEYGKLKKTLALCNGKTQNKISQNSITPVSNILAKRTEELSREISDHIKTKLELNQKIVSLNANHEFFDEVIDCIPGPLVLKNKDGTCLTCNKAFENLVGSKKEKFIGKPLLSFLPSDLAEVIHNSDEEVLETGLTSIREVKYINKNGFELSMLIYKNKILLAPESEPGTLTLIVDITQVRKAEDLLNIQYTIDYISSLNKGLKKTLENILEHIFKLYWVDIGGIYLYDKQHKTLNLVCHKGLSSSFINQNISFDKNSLQLKLLNKRESLYKKSSELPSKIKAIVQSEGVTYAVILPLINSKTNEIIGSLNLASKRVDQLSDLDRKGIDSISSRIVNLILYAQSQEKIKGARSLLAKKVEKKTSVLKKAINELTQKENEILLSGEKYKKLQDNIPIGIFSTNIQGQIQHLNLSALTMLGYDSKDELLNVSVKNLFDSPEKGAELIKSLSQQGSINNAEARLIRKDKSVFWGMISIKTQLDNDYCPIQFDGIIEDISEVKRTKTELEEANRKIISINTDLEEKIEKALKKQESQNSLLIQKSKLESLGELSAGIAHEINQPLGVMALTFENLKMKINTSKTTPDYLTTKFESIEKNIRRIREIIDHIFTFSRDQESFTLEKIDVNQVVHRALSVIGAQYSNHNIRIKLELEENIGFTIGSNFKLEQVILNLLSNSKYALEEKAIYMNETEYIKEILIKTESISDKIILRVEDNGEGIKYKNLQRLFDPFFTTKPEGSGTGLGLSIVYGIVKDMRGEILVNSKEKKYTRFRISLPRFPDNS